jgi:putative ABC transport system permease protein
MAINKTGIKMFFRIVFKSLKVRKSRVAIAFFSIAIGASIITALSSVYFDISSKMSRELRSYGANFFVGPETSSGGRDIAHKIYEELLREMPSDRLIAASPYVYGIVELDSGNAVMAGVDFGALNRLSPYWQVEGRWITVAFDDRHCMLGKTLAAKTKLKPGDGVNITGINTGIQRSFIVRGIIETGQAEDSRIFVNIHTAQEMLNMKGRINYAMMSLVTEGMNIEETASGIEKKFSGIAAKPIRKVSYSDGKILNKIKGLMAFVSLIILTVTTLCVMTTLIAGVAERTKEIGLMKALGAENSGIVRQFLVETGFIGLAGALAGAASGFILAQALGRVVFNSYISFRPEAILLTIAVSISASLIAAVIPVRMAVMVEPAQVLKGE